MDERLKYMAKTGYAAKGIVYLISGILACGAAIGLSSSAEGKLGVLEFLQRQSFGNVLVLLLSAGLLCYAFWRIIQGIKDPENIGSERSAIGKRFAFFLSGLFYFGLAIYAVTQLIGGSSDDEASSESFVPIEWMPYLFYAIALGVAIKSVFQFVKVYKGDFLKKFDLSGVSKHSQIKTMKLLGYSGLMARGIMAGIVSYFFFKAAQTAGANEKLKGTAEAFRFLRNNSEGPWLMGTVAVGLTCYGLYICVMAKYPSFDN